MNAQTSQNQLDSVSIKWTRFDTKIFPVQPNLYLKIFWKLARSKHNNRIVQKAASLTVHTYDIETVKFDLLFDKPCHFHLAPVWQQRLTLDGNKPTECIPEIKTRLIESCQHWLQQHPNSDIRNIIIDTDNLRRNADMACDQLHNYICNMDKLIKVNHRP